MYTSQPKPLTSDEEYVKVLIEKLSLKDKLDIAEKAASFYKAAWLGQHPKFVPK